MTASLRPRRSTGSGRGNRYRQFVVACGAFFLGFAAASGLSAAEGKPAAAKPAVAVAPGEVASFVKKQCVACHDADSPEAGLNLAGLGFGVDDAAVHARWVKVYDRVAAGEMPPKDEPKPPAAEVKKFLSGLEGPLASADRARAASEGRAVRRRLNRYEYEYSLRDLLGAPWLQVRSMLPEDGESARFNKLGGALDVSHVQMAQYLAAADYAFRETLPPHPQPPKREVVRHYARDQNAIARKMIFNEFNRAPERATFPVLDYEGQPDVRSTKLPLTRGAADPALREREAMGTVASSYEPIELKFDRFKAPYSGKYKLKLSAYAVWVGPGKEPAKNPKWWRPDLDTVSKGKRPEPVTLYAEAVPRQLRRLTTVDVGVEPTVVEFEAWLQKGETIRVDAARLFRSRPPGTTWRNPLATPEGQPGVAFKWLEVDGPVFESWPTAGQKLLFGDLPFVKTGRADRPCEPAPREAAADSDRLLRGFIARAYRRPPTPEEVERFLGVVRGATADGNGFVDSLLAGYAAVLCSPGFVSVEEKPGALDDRALAARLSYFLWNSEPDDALRKLAEKGELRKGKNLARQTERLLADPRSERFVEAFLDYWLDLRHIEGTSPDAELYGDYYLDDLLVESALLEPRAYFSLMLKEDLPAKHVAAADFVVVNERLADHYGIPGVEGSALRKIPLPAGSPRGGLFTQAAVLKVTANGTTTSPVVRGAWFMERILGQPPPPPPPGIPAVEPDVRGAKTIREQLAKHRSQTSCAACHAKIDPAGFALEQFDVLGGFRTQYRAVGESEEKKPPPPVVGWGKNGQPFAFRASQPIDASGNLPDGRSFHDVRELKKLLLADERALARNLARQLATYATGASVRFGDRSEIEAILDRAAPSKYGVRTLVREIVQSPLFLNK